jgi:hypothetical protein
MTPDFSKLLQALPVSAPITAKLRRFVAKDALYSRTPPNFLYTTGYAYRVNTAASLALYGAEDAATAGAEWERHAKKSPRPLTQVLYFIDLSVPVVDLGDAAVLAGVHLTEADLQAPWEFEPAPTKLQRFGDAVAQQQRFGAVRLPSDAARVRGFKGFNFVMFPSAIVSPMSVVIRDDADTEIQRWPAP